MGKGGGCTLMKAMISAFLAEPYIIYSEWDKRR